MAWALRSWVESRLRHGHFSSHIRVVLSCVGRGLIGGLSLVYTGVLPSV
jgi:hypothetical protein